MSTYVVTAGVLRERWDDVTRIYTVWDAAGVQVAAFPYSAEQNAAADAGASARQIEANAATLLAQVADQLDAIRQLVGSSSDPAGTTSLRAIKATPNQTINSSPAAYVKAVNQATIDLAQAVSRLSRLTARALDTTSTTNA